MKYLIYILFTITLGVFVSCKSSRTFEVAVLKSQSNLFFDEGWQKKLDNSKDEMISVVNNLITYEDVKSLQNSGIKINLTEEEYGKLEYRPINVLVIDSATFMNWDTCTSIVPKIKLQKDEASCFVFKKGQMLFDVKMRNDRKYWEPRGYSGFNETLALALYDKCINKNENVYRLYLDSRTHSNDRHESPYIVYFKYGELTALINNQKEVALNKLLTDEFRYLKSGKAPNFMQEIMDFIKNAKQ
jgi:hypothetical protein